MTDIKFEASCITEEDDSLRVLSTDGPISSWALVEVWEEGRPCKMLLRPSKALELADLIIAKYRPEEVEDTPTLEDLVEAVGELIEAVGERVEAVRELGATVEGSL